MKNESLLSSMRKKYVPKTPQILKDLRSLQSIKSMSSVNNIDDGIKDIFPNIHNQPMVSFNPSDDVPVNSLMKIGVVFSGGQAPGGHNVISGIFDAIKQLNSENILLGFLNGPVGITDNKYIEITKELLLDYRNQGGFDLIGSGRTKIETKEQLEAAKEVAEELDLDGIVVVGGDDSNTNAAILAEYFVANNSKTMVVGVPKTIDGDLKNEYIHSSFGFDTASKVYSELIGNIARDAISAKKYYHFIKLMGRSASHITLECALRTAPNFVFIAEEVESNNKTLNDLTSELADFIYERASLGKDYGVVLIPEGLIEFIPEVKKLIGELNSLLGKNDEIINQITLLSDDKKKIDLILSKLSDESKNTFMSLPDKIKLQLLIDRDPHGNVQVSKIETEKLFAMTVEENLKRRDSYKGKFNVQTHFFGYEGRACFPTNFDANYCYNLGLVAALLLKDNLTGYICCIDNLSKPVENWLPRGVPLVSLMNMEVRKGKEKPVIRKALVGLNSKSYKSYLSRRDSWKTDDNYFYPGPIQYFGEEALTENISIILENDYS